MKPAGILRDHLLTVVKRLKITENLEIQHASRLYLWTIEAEKQRYDELLPTGRNHPSRFLVATIYELGEVLLYLKSPDAPRDYSKGDVRQLFKLDLHRRCSWVRAKIRSILDGVIAKQVRRLSEYFEFISHDLACCFEWKARRLQFYGEAFEDILCRLQAAIPPSNDIEPRRAEGKPGCFHGALNRLQKLVMVGIDRLNRHGLYQDGPPASSTSQTSVQIEVLTVEEMKSRIENEKPFLVVTVTGDEFQETFSLLEPYHQGKICACFLFLSRVYLGRMAERTVLLTQCEMGSAGLGASQAITTLLLDTFTRIRCVVAVGICFGIDRKTQQFGDLVVADFIQPYENQKVKPKPVPTEYRNYHLPSGPILSKAFRGSLRTFKLQNGTREQAVHFGGVLSGEKVIDNRGFRDELVAKWPHVAGGEMEGVGVYTACFGRPGVQAILVKSICDFADGDKDDRWQVYCAKLSAEYVKEVLRREAIRDLIELSLLQPEDDDA